MNESDFARVPLRGRNCKVQARRAVRLISTIWVMIVISTRALFQCVTRYINMAESSKPDSGYRVLCRMSMPFGLDDAAAA